LANAFSRFDVQRRRSIASGQPYPVIPSVARAWLRRSFARLVPAQHV